MGVKFAVVITLIFTVFSHGVRTENLGCSFQGLELDKCLNQNGQYIFLEPCCRVLNLALRAGFHCLCSIMAADHPQFSTLISWSMSSCYISVPPITMCRGTMPVTLPVPHNLPKLSQSAQTNQEIPLFPPPQPISSISNSSSNNLNTPTKVSENATQILHVSDVGIDKSDYSSGVTYVVYCYYTWLLSVAFYSIFFIA